MADIAEQGLQLIHSVHARGELGDYDLLWTARADTLRRLNRWGQSRPLHTARPVASQDRTRAKIPHVPPG